MTRASRALTLSQAADLYLAACSNRLAKGTIHSYRMSLNAFVKSVGDIQLGSVTHKHADKFFASRQALKASYRNQNRAHLRTFFAWLRQSGYIAAGHDPFFAYAKAFVAVPDEKLFIDLEDFGRLLDSAKHPRDRAAIALGIYLQLRGGDIRDLRVQNVDLDGLWVSTVISKVRKRDRKPICEELAVELRRWFAWYEDRVGPLRGDWFLVPAKTKPKIGYDRGVGRTRMRPDSIGVIPDKKAPERSNAVHDALRGIGVEPPRGTGTHTLRRSGLNAIVQTLAPEMGQAEAVEIARVAANHGNSQTTEIYLQLDTLREKRDSIVRGQRLFKTPAGTGDNVIPLRRQAVGG